MSASYRNVGTQAAPKFSGFDEVISATELGDDSKVCVVDWDLDGKLDLVVGDHGKEFEKVHSSHDEEEKLAAKKLQDDAKSRWGSAYRSYSQYLKRKAKPDVIEYYRQLMIEENQKQEAADARIKEMSLRKQYHGNVWVFLRK